MLHSHHKAIIRILFSQFHKQDQKDGESVAEFISELKRLSTNCNYLDDALRDRFMCGLKKDLIQKKLLSGSDLNFTKVVETAQSIEAVDKQARPMKMGTTEQDSELNQVSQKITCFRCGKSNHKANQCRFRDAECHKCSKCEHLKSVCRSLKVFQDRNFGKCFKDASRSSSKFEKTEYRFVSQYGVV